MATSTTSPRNRDANHDRDVGGNLRQRSSTSTRRLSDYLQGVGFITLSER
jgi:hypothetical protein